MNAHARSRRHVCGGPITEIRPDSCADMADVPRPVERAGWTLLEVVGAATLCGGWLYMLWFVIEGL